jgi:hypothetical protein
MSTDQSMWHKKFPRWNAANLETEGVRDHNQSVLVHQEHPVIEFIRQNDFNPVYCPCRIDDQKKLDGEWYLLSRLLFTTCCSSLRQHEIFSCQCI